MSKKKYNMPDSWYTPAVKLNEHGDVSVYELDRDFDERYEAAQGVLIPVASYDGQVLSEKKQKAVIKHFLTGFSRTKFDLMIGVLRRDPEETVTQIIRWCELFKRITGKKHYEDALQRLGVRAFAVCAPREVTNPVVQRRTFIDALELGLPTAIYQVPRLSKAEIDPDLIRELVSTYDNLLLVIGDEQDSAEAAPADGASDQSAEEAEDVSNPAIDETRAAEISSLMEQLRYNTPGMDCTVPRDHALVVQDKSEHALVPADFASVKAAGEAGIEAITTDLHTEARSEKSQGISDLSKRKIMRRVVAAEVVAALLMSFAIFDTVQVHAGDKRSDAIAATSAERFVANASPVMSIGSVAVNQEAEDAILQARIDKIIDAALNMEYVEEERDYDIEESQTYELVQGAYEWGGSVLSRSAGAVTGPNGRETYYNLNMSGVVSIMRRMGNTDTYWVRSDGCKMLGNYIMVAANLNVHPRGSIVRSSRGLAIVCDTGGFASHNPQQLDVATTW